MYRLERINTNRDLKELYDFMDGKGMISTNAYHLFIIDFTRKLKFEYKDFNIVRCENGSIAGYIGMLEYHIFDNNCRVEIVGDIIALEYVLKEYLIQMHKNYPIKKAFFEIEANNMDLLSLLKKTGANEEAILKEYRFNHGCYCDVIIMGIDLQNE